MKSRFWVFILLTTIYGSCNLIEYKPVDYNKDSSSLSPLAKKSLDKKLQNYKSKLQEKCRTKALQAAIVHVDSLIIKEMKLHHKESMSFPNRPVKPKLPEGIVLNDSTMVEKI